MRKPIVLRVYKNEQLLEVKQFLQPQIVVGRAGPEAEAQLVLAGDSVSVLHASIEDRGDEKFHISDLGSVNGTFKNGQLVLDSPLESGDILQVGEYKIEFFHGAPKTKTAIPNQPTAPIVPPAPVLESVPVAPPPQVSSSLLPPPVEREKPIEQMRPVLAPAPQPPPPIRPTAASLSPRPGPAVVAEESVGSLNAHNIVGPKTRVHQNSSQNFRKSHGKGRGKKTFAPKSKYSDIKEFVKPSKGTVVEVLVAWGERIIGNYHFSQAKTVTIGSHPDNDIVVPVLSSKIRKLPILKIDKQAIVLVGSEFRGEVMRGQTSSSFADLIRQNRLVKAGKGYSLALDQGEMAKIELSEQVAVIIRYVSDSPKASLIPQQRSKL